MERFAGIDPHDVLTALGIVNVTDVQPISGGLDTLIWKVTTDCHTYALRLFRPDQREQCRNEIHAMRILEALAVPVPRITGHGVWENRPAMLMEWCRGRTVIEEAKEHPASIESLAASMGRLQARMHAVSVPREYWDNHQSWLDMVGPGESELKVRLRAISLEDGHPLHLDFHPRNVMCVGEEASVILDWANVKVGDPRADVARTRSILRLATPDSESKEIRERFERAWMAGITQIAGTLHHMELFEIWSSLVFIRDMKQYLGRPGFWLQASDFDSILQRISALKRQAGIA